MATPMTQPRPRLTRFCAYLVAVLTLLCALPQTEASPRRRLYRIRPASFSATPRSPRGTTRLPRGLRIFRQNRSEPTAAIAARNLRLANVQYDPDVRPAVDAIPAIVTVAVHTAAEIANRSQSALFGSVYTVPTRLGMSQQISDEIVEWLRETTGEEHPPVKVDGLRHVLLFAIDRALMMGAQTYKNMLGDMFIGEAI
jgi:hypothetical protein